MVDSICTIIFGVGILVGVVAKLRAFCSRHSSSLEIVQEKGFLIHLLVSTLSLKDDLLAFEVFL